MRCPSCGTQNEPDSRFCGGCGARLSAVEHRVAPTQRIDSGAQPIVAPPHPSVPPVSGPHVVPRPPPQAPAPYPVAPSVERKPSGPRPQPALPSNGTARATTQSPRPSPDPSLSLPAAPPRNRLGLIAFVLLLDLGLAAAGSWMLKEGLAEPASAATSPGPPGPPPSPPPGMH
jgi:hypothetical protein